MKYTQTFFIENRYLGCRERIHEVIHAEKVAPSSQLWFCPSCGEVWARIPSISLFDSTSPWQSFRRSCRKCGENQEESFEIPGSILLLWEFDLIDTLPEDVVRWEFERNFLILEK